MQFLARKSSVDREKSQFAALAFFTQETRDNQHNIVTVAVVVVVLYFGTVSKAWESGSELGRSFFPHNNNNNNNNNNNKSTHY